MSQTLWGKQDDSHFTDGETKAKKCCSWHLNLGVSDSSACSRLWNGPTRLKCYQQGWHTSAQLHMPPLPADSFLGNSLQLTHMTTPEKKRKHFAIYFFYFFSFSSCFRGTWYKFPCGLFEGCLLCRNSLPHFQSILCSLENKCGEKASFSSSFSWYSGCCLIPCIRNWQWLEDQENKQ